MNVPQPVPSPEEPIVDLVPIVRRVVAARISDPATRDDIVQETLARVMASRSRVEHESLVPYAMTTARNLFAEADGQEPRPEDELLRQEEASLVDTAMSRLTPAEQDILLAHEVEGTDTATLAASHGSTPGAIAAQLGRTRSRLRVEYLVAQSGSQPPTD